VKTLRAFSLAALLCSGAALAAERPVDELQRDGEAALRRGDSQQALDAFERAALLRHSAPIEIGIVRSLMQMGAYRRALAFAGHTAFAHPESHDGAQLYTLLLRLGGQPAVAQRLMQAAPPDGARVQALAALAPSGAAVPATAVVAGNATLLPDGRHAIVPSSQLPADGALWLRNGLGRTVRVERHRRDGPGGVATLRLSEAMDAWPAAARRPFPGTPAFVVAFDRAATWPQLHSGFLGSLADDTNGQWLGIETGAHAAGAAVFDSNARLLGMALPAAADGRLRFIGLAAASPQVPVTQPADVGSSAKYSVDELYERSLRSVLQLIVER
jgi:hypothetical protein